MKCVKGRGSCESRHSLEDIIKIGLGLIFCADENQTELIHDCSQRWIVMDLLILIFITICSCKISRIIINISRKVPHHGCDIPTYLD
jgi:hypothetical protein